MGFEVEKKKKNQGELWDQYDSSSYTKPIHSNKILQPADNSNDKFASSPKQKNIGSSRQRTTGSFGQRTGASYRQKAAGSSAQRFSGERPKQAKSSHAALFITLVISVMATSFAVSLISYTNTSTRKKQTESGRSYFSGNTTGVQYPNVQTIVPLPTGMEFDRYEMVGQTLKIYVKGKAETSRISYITSSVFSFALNETASKVIFVEEDTGLQYEFDRSN